MTAADHIRELAERMGYWTAPAAQQLAIRKAIATGFPPLKADGSDGEPYSRQAIADALKRRAKPGRPKHPRCPHCGRPMPTKSQQVDTTP